jgi:hypothetical protein
MPRSTNTLPQITEQYEYRINVFHPLTNAQPVLSLGVLPILLTVLMACILLAWLVFFVPFEIAVILFSGLLALTVVKYSLLLLQTLGTRLVAQI